MRFITDSLQLHLHHVAIVSVPYRFHEQQTPRQEERCHGRALIWMEIHKNMADVVPSVLTNLYIIQHQLSSTCIILSHEILLHNYSHGHLFF